MSLRELTFERHKIAERQEFVKVLFSGNINPLFYATFLKNQHPMYEFLEVNADINRVTEGLFDYHRSFKILEDYLELWPDDEDNKPTILPVVKDYLDHIKHLSATEPRLLMAHIYVRHMGDLAGGQMIAKKVPGSGKFYQFKDPNALKLAIREKLDDSLSEEANTCFDFAIRTFNELMLLDIPKYNNE